MSIDLEVAVRKLWSDLPVEGTLLRFSEGTAISIGNSNISKQSTTTLYRNEKRRIEFKAGRQCAAQVLGRLEVPRDARWLVRATDGSPVWPEGIVGSISHTDGVAIAVAGRRQDYRGLGVDIERISYRTFEFVQRVCRKEDIENVVENPWVSVEQTITMLFSIRESFYKCIYPVLHLDLDFHDCVVDVDFLNCRFQAKLFSQLEAFAANTLNVHGRMVWGGEYVVVLCIWQAPHVENDESVMYS